MALQTVLMIVLVAMVRRPHLHEAVGKGLAAWLTVRAGCLGSSRAMGRHASFCACAPVLLTAVGGPTARGPGARLVVAVSERAVDGAVATKAVLRSRRPSVRPRRSSLSGRPARQARRDRPARRRRPGRLAGSCTLTVAAGRSRGRTGPRPAVSRSAARAPDLRPRSATTSGTARGSARSPDRGAVRAGQADRPAALVPRAA